MNKIISIVTKPRNEISFGIASWLKAREGEKIRNTNVPAEPWFENE